MFSHFIALLEEVTSGWNSEKKLLLLDVDPVRVKGILWILAQTWCVLTGLLHHKTTISNLVTYV